METNRPARNAIDRIEERPSKPPTRDQAGAAGDAWLSGQFSRLRSDPNWRSVQGVDHSGVQVSSDIAAKSHSRATRTIGEMVELVQGGRNSEIHRGGCSFRKTTTDRNGEELSCRAMRDGLRHSANGAAACGSADSEVGYGSKLC